MKVLLEKESNFKIFTNDNKDVKISLINYLKPDIILIGLENLDESDFSYLKIFHKLNKDPYQLKHFNQLKIIIFAAEVDELTLNKALELGCQGYLLKESSIEELKQAIRSVYHGYKHIGNSVFTQIQRFSRDRKSESAILEKNSNNNLEHYHTGLLTTNSNELVLENINTNNEKIVIQESESSITTTYPQELDRDKQSSWFRSIGSSLILISLGCAAGIVGLISVNSSNAKSFSPIVKNGIINGEISPLKTPYVGTIKELAYEVGALVTEDRTVAKIEPQYNQEQRQTIAAITQQIEQIQQQIDNKKRSLAVPQSHLISARQQLQQLLQMREPVSPIVPASTSTSSKPVLRDVQAKTETALENYKRLQKLKQQKLVSQQELDNAKQTWEIAQNKLVTVQNSNLTNVTTSQEVVVNSHPKNKEKKEKLDNLFENIARWQNQISNQKNTINFLSTELNHAKEQLSKVKSRYEEQKIIDIKAPFTGIIYQINGNANELLAEDRTIVELVNCNNLWVEVIVNEDTLSEINFQQSAVLKFSEHQDILVGNISLIQPLSHDSKDYIIEQAEQSYNIQSRSSDNLADENLLFKVVIDFSMPENYFTQHEFCGLEQSTIVTFNN